MSTIAKIALSIPNPDKPGRYFSFRLKYELYNEPSEYSKPDTLLALSDIEGNFQPFCRLLMNNKVIDKYFDWTFGDGHLVIVGDCFDRGEQVVECLWLIYMLEEKARKKGGKVHFILGNHEVMNLNGDWRYVHPKYAVETKSQSPHTALYDGNSELWRWLRTKNIVEKIGDILFVHGGISPELLKFDLSVEDINIRARPWYIKTKEFLNDSFLNLLFNSDNSPFWYRGYYLGEVTEKQISDTINHFGVNTIVTGHTVMDCVTAFFNGTVINVDTNHAIGNSEALLFRKGEFFRVHSSGKKEKLK